MAALDRRCAILFLCVACLSKFANGTNPTLSNIPIDLTVGELETADRVIYTLVVSDASQHSFTCSQTSMTSVPAVSTLFTMLRNPETNEWNVRTNLGGVVAFATGEVYTITVVCTDGNGLSSTGDITVSVKAGQKITFDTLPRTVTYPALTTGSNVLIHSATASNDLGETLDYYLTTETALDDTYFIIDQASGNVKSAKALSGIDSLTPSVKLKIRTTDGVINVTEYLTVALTSQNTKPTTPTLPLNLTRIETLATGTTLFTLSTVDPDSTQTLTYTFDCTPVAYQSYFEIDSNGNFKLKSPNTLNYEAATLHSCNVYIDDTIHKAGPFLFQLTVSDDNEECAFSKPLHSTSTVEGTANSVSINPGFIVTDVDAADSVFTYSFLNFNNSNRFSMDSSTGIVTYSIDYDIDNSNLPSDVYLTVLAVDQGGPTGTKKTCSTLLQITIADVNDNAPSFGSASYTITVSQLVTPGSLVGSIIPTDIDTGSNGEFACSPSLLSGTDGYYTIGADCNIYLSKAIDFENGRTMTYRTLAIDNGSPQLTGSTTVNIIYSEVTTTTVTTTTTTAAYDFWDHGENIAMFIMTLLLGLLLLAGLLYCCIRYCCMGGKMDCLGRGDCCTRRRYPPRQVTPETPPRPRKKVESIERSPVIVREQPRMVERPRLVRTVMAPQRYGPPPAYSSWRGVGPPGRFVGPDPYSGALFP